MNTESFQKWISKILDNQATWESSWEHFRPDETLGVDDHTFETVLEEFEGRLKENYPFFHPRYAGQMIKPPHPVAVAAYFRAMMINPNNHALDGGPATAAMEIEVVADIAKMFGYSNHLGHITSSGTIANLEALWIAKSLHPGKAIAFSTMSHYTHKRMCEVLGARSVEIHTDAAGKIDCEELEAALKQGTIGTVVANMGSTSLGSVDPLEKIIPLCKKYNVRVHGDAAYGGFFILLARQDHPMVSAEPFLHLSQCDSIVVDPHKHGLQPYGCGCVLFSDPSVGRFYKHDSPYTYFTSKKLHLGEISLECSRPGASPAALWFTLKCFPLLPEKGLGAVLSKTRKAALLFSELLENNQSLTEYVKADLDIVTYFPTTKGGTASAISEATATLFSTGMNLAPHPLYLALLTVDSRQLKTLHGEVIIDQPNTAILRSVLMKPEHYSFVPGFVKELEILSGRSREQGKS
jgi:glutamate/tyrosine decarboxylase-like PLP-dependent enzyme